MNIEEKTLAAKGGDKNAFSELIGERKEILYRVAFMYVKNEDAALEIVSETVYRAYVSIKKLKEPKFFYTWLTKILINCANDYIKKNSKVINLNEDIDLKVEEQGISKEEKIDLYTAVEKLKGKYKTVVILKYFEDLKINEIADILECPANTVKTYLHKALCDLRLELKEVI